MARGLISTLQITRIFHNLGRPDGEDASFCAVLITLDQRLSQVNTKRDVMVVDLPTIGVDIGKTGGSIFIDVDAIN